MDVGDGVSDEEALGPVALGRCCSRARSRTGCRGPCCRGTRRSRGRTGSPCPGRRTSCRPCGPRPRSRRRSRRSPASTRGPTACCRGTCCGPRRCDECVACAEALPALICTPSPLIRAISLSTIHTKLVLAADADAVVVLVRGGVHVAEIVEVVPVDDHLGAVREDLAHALAPCRPSSRSCEPRRGRRPTESFPLPEELAQLKLMFSMT